MQISSTRRIKLCKISALRPAAVDKVKTPFLGVSYWSEVAVWKVIFIIYKSQEHLDELPVVDPAVPVAVRGADHLVHLLVTQALAQVHQHLPGGGYQP